MGEPTQIALRESWGGAAERGLQARQERQKIVERVLRPESSQGAGDGDFGIIPGTKKPTLLKPGAEKIVDALDLYPFYDPVSTTEDYGLPLFAYRYRCSLRQRGSDVTVATGIGSCNSMEGRYRWRTQSRVCPKCGQETIIKGKEEYGGGWLCFAKKGGCGAKYDGDDVAITSQKQGQVANDDVFSVVNTVDKMAQKRSLIAATLNLGFSEQFTQDVEDLPAESRAQSQEAARDDKPREQQAAPRPQPARGKSDDPWKTPIPPTWKGKLDRMKIDSGEKNGKPWERADFIGADGTILKTFDTSHAAALAKLIGTEVEITYSYGRGGGWMIEEWKQVANV